LFEIDKKYFIDPEIKFIKNLARFFSIMVKIDKTAAIDPLIL